MKVLVIGANGQIGQHLVDLLQNSDEHKLRAMVRKEEQRDALQEKGVEAVLADLEGSVEAIAEAAKGCDAVVFTAGSGGSTGADKTLLVDLDGAIKSVEAAEKAGVDRFVMVSGYQANNRENWNEKIKHYYVAKHYADETLKNSSLNYTILRPGGLLNEPGTGKIAAAEQLQPGSIPREDVARTIVAALNEEKTYKQSFDLMSGETEIDDVLKNIG
ncbi:SDR family oxidoreductase [Virgibacillus doumboii]|uniref:SDR family oxidoreductase n=1 Tax=Virgibacillus doumboii TaxID=2697503 RepID=UPI0013DF9FCF|nr:SDR family oxidoreductase [Virgibacillus doumboii]